MKTVFTVLFLLLLSFQLISCATNEPIDNAHPYADIGEGFMTQEPRTVREDRYQPHQYFYKQCEQEFRESHFSKTAYFCNER